MHKLGALAGKDYRKLPLLYIPLAISKYRERVYQLRLLFVGFSLLTLTAAGYLLFVKSFWCLLFIGGTGGLVAIVRKLKPPSRQTGYLLSTYFCLYDKEKHILYLYTTEGFHAVRLARCRLRKMQIKGEHVAIHLRARGLEETLTLYLNTRGWQVLREYLIKHTL